MKNFRTESDAGAVAVGTAGFKTLIRNGYGDGTTFVYVLERGERHPQGATFETSVEGEFNIYSYDCEPSIPKITLRGRYGVFSNEGVVYFEPWNSDCEIKYNVI